MNAGNLYVKIGVDLSALRAGLAESKGMMSRWGNDMQSAGSTLTTSVSAPLAIAGGWAIKLAGNLEATALSFKVLTKDAAAALSIQKQLNDYADKSPFESEDVTLAGKRMIAYKFAVRDVMPYLKDAGDLAAAFADQGVKVADIAGVFGRLKSGDFGEAFERLRDFGISREQLEGKGLKFDKGGEYKGSVQTALAGVRAIIQENYGGMAEALGTTLPGMLATGSDSISRFATEIGTEIVKAFDVKGLLADFASFLNETKAAFMALSPEAKKAALAVVGLTIALPPLMAALGALVTTVLPAIAAGFAAIASPITAVGLAVGGLIFYWDTFNAIVDKTIARLYQLKGALLTAMGFGDAGANAMKQGSLWWQAGKDRDAAIAEPQRKAREEAEKQAMLARNATRRSTRFGSDSSPATNYGSKSNADLAGMESAAKKAKAAIKELTDGTQKLLDTLTEISRANIVDPMRRAQQEIIDAADRQKREIQNAIATAGMKRVVLLKIEEETQKMLELIRLKYEVRQRPHSSGGTTSSKDENNDVGSSKPQKAGGLQAELLEKTKSLPNLSTFWAKNVTPGKDALQSVIDSWDDFGEELKKTLQGVTVNVFTGIGEMLGAMAMGTAGAGDLGKVLMSSLGGLLVQLGKLAIQVGVGLLGIKKAMMSMNPFVAIAAGVALVAMGSMVSSATSNMGGKIGGKVPKFAGGYGGAYKPTMMMFGDHPNASSNNPEFVLTQDQVKSMLNRAADNAGGGGNGDLVADVRLKGQDLLLAIRRATNNSIN